MRLMMVKEVKITQNDIVIALMGRTGSGKSNFINVAAKLEGKNVGHGLESFTRNIQTFRVHDPEIGRPVVFVDTPGFDDTHRSDTDVLDMIAQWLAKTHKDKIQLAGIIYVQRISDKRMRGHAHKNLHLFKKVCGRPAIRNVVLATTMWSEVDQEVGIEREQELKNNFWKTMLDSGAATARFLNTSESAWSIVDTIHQMGFADTLLIQKEMVELGRRVSETQAGMALYKSLQQLLASQRDTTRQLRQSLDDDKQLELWEELYRMQENMRLTLDQIRALNIPLGRRILMFFSFRNAKFYDLS